MPTNWVQFYLPSLENIQSKNLSKTEPKQIRNRTGTETEPKLQRQPKPPTLSYLQVFSKLESIRALKFT